MFTLINGVLIDTGGLVDTRNWYKAIAGLKGQLSRKYELEFLEMELSSSLLDVERDIKYIREELQKLKQRSAAAL